jgi:hypothetical protein
MLKLSGRRELPSSRASILLGCAISVCALPPSAWAESLPASVRACAAESDSLRRLTCYDREVARFQEPPKATSQPKPAPPPSDATKHEPLANPPASSAPAASASTSAAPSPGDQPRSAAADKAGNASGHVSARVLSIDRSPNEMVLHLDNGQVWQELQSTSGDLSLQVGDTVNIDKHLGSYWLTGPHVSGMRVRQKT